MNRPTIAVLAAALAVAACGPKKAPANNGSVDLAADSEWFGGGQPGSDAAAPSGGTPGQPAAAAPPGAICGEVRLSAEVASALPSDPASWWILVYARSGSAAGPVVAAIKGKLPPAFPVKFCLTSKNVISQGAPFTGALWINAVIDGDGEPEIDPGDFDGTTAAPVPVGTRNAVVTIDTFR